MTDSDEPVATESDELSWKRALLGGAGCLVLVGAFTSAAGVATATVSAVRGLVDNDYLLVMAFGGVAVALAGTVFVADRDSVRTTSPPEVERPTPAPAPGEPFDDRLDSWRTMVPLVGRQSRAVVRERLRRVAVQAVAVEHGRSEAEAATAVADGSWTDDEVAAEFLTPSSGPAIVGVTMAALANGETPVRYCACRTIAAVDEISEQGGGRSR